KWDAEMFAHACRFAVLIAERNPVIFADREYFKGQNLSHPKIVHLEALGLLQSGSVLKPGPSGVITFWYAGKMYQVARLPVDQQRFLIPFEGGIDIFGFTQVGFELRQLVDAQPIDGYIEAVKKYAEQLDFSMVEAESAGSIGW